ncbi:MAG: Flagellum site-determining protein YlxH [Firmicutes bacterium]|nr:Flagellum site-determining protein YlxH [candidate division NPL-UPA2 bacterium]
MKWDQAHLLRQLVGKAAPRQRARVITIVSGKGGVGKTNLVVNLGIALSRNGKTTTIVDADLGLANVDVVLGQYFEHDLEHVIKGEKRLEEIIGFGPYGLRIVPSASGVQEMANMSPEERERLITELATLEYNTDFLIFDTGAGISRNVLAFANLADEVVVVVTPEPTSIADAYALVKLLVTTRAASSIALVVNRSLSIEDGRTTGERFMTLAERFLRHKVRLIGVVSDDVIVSQAVRRQHPFVLSHPESTPSRQVDAIARNLAGETVPPVAERGLLLGLKRLFGGR